MEKRLNGEQDDQNRENQYREIEMTKPSNTHSADATKFYIDPPEKYRSLLSEMHKAIDLEDKNFGSYGEECALFALAKKDAEILALQARVEQLREALQDIELNTPSTGCRIIAHKALSQTDNHAALREALEAEYIRGRTAMAAEQDKYWNAESAARRMEALEAENAALKADRASTTASSGDATEMCAEQRTQEKISIVVLKQMISQLATVSSDPRGTSDAYWEEKIFAELDKRDAELAATRAEQNRYWDAESAAKRMEALEAENAKLIADRASTNASSSNATEMCAEQDRQREEFDSWDEDY